MCVCGSVSGESEAGVHTLQVKTGRRQYARERWWWDEKEEKEAEDRGRCWWREERKYHRSKQEEKQVEAGTR